MNTANGRFAVIWTDFDSAIMADPVCFSCPTPATNVQISSDSLRFLCKYHGPSAKITSATPQLYSLALHLHHHPAIAAQYWALSHTLPDKIIQELKNSWNCTEETCRFRVIGQPEDLLELRDRDRVLRFLSKAGLKFPNLFVGEARAETILVTMVKYRASISVIPLVFEKWPAGKDKFRVLEAIIRSKYASIEKKLLMELLLPYYVELALNQSTVRSKAVIERLKDRTLKAFAYSYIRYLENLYVLKATEINPVTRRLPKPLRRYIVEIFITAS